MTRNKKTLLWGFVVLAAVAAALYFEKPWEKLLGPPLDFYSHPAFGVSFRYPASWSVDAKGGAFLGIPLRYEGTSGYFGIDALAAEEKVGIDAAVEQLTGKNSGAPYGSKPSIRHMEFYGREARMVLPSSDQPEASRGGALLLARYPNGKQIGDNFFRFFILYADKGHIEDIVKTLKFSD